MDEGLHRFWFKFDVPGPHDPADPGITLDGSDTFTPEGAVRAGVGVTGATEDDCLDFIQRRIFKGVALPPVAQIVRDVDVSTLGDGVLNWMEPPVWEGIWYPRGYAEPPTTG